MCRIPVHRRPPRPHEPTPQIKPPQTTKQTNQPPNSYACRTPKHIREMADSARRKRRLAVPDAGAALLPAILQVRLFVCVP